MSIPPEASSLMVSFIGMKTEEIPINGRNAIDVHLSSDVAQLNEVVVMGYGAVQKKSLLVRLVEFQLMMALEPTPRASLKLLQLPQSLSKLILNLPLTNLFQLSRMVK